MTRSERIREARQQQPLADLERKAAKARRRQNIWTVEELDAAFARADDLIKNIAWE